MKTDLQRSHSWAILGIFWLVAAVADRLWFALDSRVPSWDQADYLTGALNYWQALQQPQWWDSHWWTSLWQLSSKIPPGTYIITAMIHQLFGIGGDRATLVNLLFSAILLFSVYGLGRELFNRKVGLWAAGLCLLFPGLYHVRLDFLLDYPLTAIVALCFYCLTVWKYRPHPSWKWAIAFGLSLGLAFMIKQTAILFLFVPILWVTVGTLWQRQWVRVGQLFGSFLLAIALMYPWYRTNWLLVLTGSKRATVDAAIAEGDPALNSLGAWTFYFDQLPNHISWPLLIVVIGGFLLYGWRTKIERQAWEHCPYEKGRWLLVFWVGSYLLCSLNVNKDFRYVLPYLPVVAIFLAYGLNLWPSPLRRSALGLEGNISKHPLIRRVGGIQLLPNIAWVPGFAVGLTLLLMVVNLWPVNDLSALKPGQHHAYLGKEWPHKKAIAEIIQTEPYLLSTLGVLPSTATVNQHNLNYYGALANFQVYGRQVGTRRSQVVQDVRSLNWFITKTGHQGSVPAEAQTATVQTVQQSADFQLHKTWPLPDGSTLQLYHRQSPAIQIKPIDIVPSPQIKLENVTLPAATPPGQTVPVTYQWLGNGKSLQNGLLLLTWQQVKGYNQQKSPLDSPLIKGTHKQQNRWLHDRAIGLGTLHSVNAQKGFQVTEKLAMLPPADIDPGIYILEATYLNRETGETYPLAVPPVQIAIDPTADPIPAPELDLVTQLRSLSTALPLGVDALGPIFDHVGRINQYDPIQDYLSQAELTLKSRLQQEPNNLKFAYNLALAEVLQRDATGAIAALEKVVKLDPKNPYAYGYLAFVNLYDLHPHAAEKAIKASLELDPNREEFQILNAIAALFQGHLIKTWNAAQVFIPGALQQILKKIVLYLFLLIGAIGSCMLWLLIYLKNNRSKNKS